MERALTQNDSDDPLPSEQIEKVREARKRSSAEPQAGVRRLGSVAARRVAERASAGGDREHSRPLLAVQAMAAELGRSARIGADRERPTA